MAKITIKLTKVIFFIFILFLFIDSFEMANILPVLSLGD